MRKPSSINRKLQTSLSIVALASLTVLLALIFVFYFIEIKTNATAEAQRSNLTNYNSVDFNLDSVYGAFITSFGTEEFLEDLYSMKHGEGAESVRYRLQNELSDFSSSTSLVFSAIVLDPDSKTAYSRYQDIISVPYDTLLTKEDMTRIKGITWLPGRKSPYLARGDVAFLVFPLNARTYTILAEDGEEADAYIIALISQESLLRLLSPLDDADHQVFLLDRAYNVIAGPSDGDIEKVRAHIDSGVYEDFKSLISVSYLEDRDVYIVDYIDKLSRLWSFVEIIAMLYASVLLVLISSMAISARFVKKNVSDPIENLVQGVKRIASGDYSHKVEVEEEKDEISLLADSFNQMSDQILVQMEEIREKEQEQYGMKLKLLTEQLNPHFIYNTLECIRHSVSSGSREEADVLISHLSTYLRTALAHGEDIVPISNEIKHIISYVRIMESRFDHAISLTIEGEKGIENALVLKSMLQPLIENSIKHGFNIDSSAPVMVNPAIAVSFRGEGENLVIEVADNGSGFDVERVSAIMTGAEEKGLHIGLQNTYGRIVTYYGKDRIKLEVSSIPYYRNAFIITVPRIVEDI